jgi:N-acetylglucosaminyl-diphospho-decaprenol L-rhamnosyltransferase
LTSSARPVDLVLSIGHVGRDYAMLADCLRSVYAEDTPGFSYEVWIVYNGPPRPGFEAELRRDFPQIARVVYEPGPLGFCRTHNLVLGAARTRHLLILDDDTIVAKGTLAGMVAFLDANPRVGMAGCKTLNPDGSFQRIWGLLPTLGTELRSIWERDVYWPARLFERPDVQQDVPWLNGSFMLARRAALDEIGLLDEHFYTYFCESDWAWRMQKAGWRVVYVPDHSIVHVGGEHSIVTAERHPVQIVRAFSNRFHYFTKHHGRLAHALLRPITAVAAAVRIVRWAAVGLVRPASRALARSRVAGFWDVVKLCFARDPDVLPEKYRS